MQARVDEHLERSWREAGLEKPPLADDATFLRRAYLDLTGRLPSVHEARAFVSNPATLKRQALVDRLVEKPTHAAHLANTWRRVLLPDGLDLRRFGGGLAFEGWLRAKLADNTPYDELVREILLAEGNFNQSGPVLFYTALELKPEEIAAATSRAFLGVQIQCAQCHDHPFDHWTQRDFWGFAAFFAQLQRPAAGTNQFAFQVGDANEGELTLPDSDEVVAAKFLQGDVSSDTAEATRRERLAGWLTSADNPYFARAAVNRVWALLFGRGLVDPADDFGGHNPASHPELLDELSHWFADSGFDLRLLVRTLAGTKTYQITSQTQPGEVIAPELFARMAIKPMTAEQLYDSLADATLRRAANQVQRRSAAFGRAYDQGRQAFVAKFQAPAGRATEYQAGIPQALSLMNGSLVSQAVDLQNSDILAGLDAPFFTTEDRVEILFLATLSRMPTTGEREKFLGYVQSKPDEAERDALANVLWALLNSAEFTLNH